MVRFLPFMVNVIVRPPEPPAVTFGIALCGALRHPRHHEHCEHRNARDEHQRDCIGGHRVTANPRNTTVTMSNTTMSNHHHSSRMRITPHGSAHGA
jgi:hypothetical protein